jgi:hypothetical protein
VNTSRRARGRAGKAALAGGALLLAALVVTGTLFLAAGASSARTSSRGQSAVQGRPIPVLAYYYIWFNPTSWNRAKSDYPLVGRYSSDDVTVMRQQVTLAKQSGLTGFIVSWKDSPVLNRRLAALRTAAATVGFKLSIVFEGRTSRQPAAHEGGSP